MNTKRFLGVALAGLLVVVAGGVWSALLNSPHVEAHTLPSGTTAGHGHFKDLTIDSGPVDFDHLTSCLRLPTDADGTLSCGTDYTWTDLTTYPAACTNGTFVEAVGDTLDCSEDETINDTWTFTPVATGAFGGYDIVVGGTYGGFSMGNVGIYSSSFTSGANLDLDKTVVFRQEGNLGVGNDPGIEFALMEGGNTIRLAVPESGSGNATAFIRSGTFAGPDPNPKTNDIVTCDYWSTYDSNIDCDTSGTGADLFVQDDFEVEGTIYAHETINLEGSTADGNQVIIQVGADPGADVTLTLPTATSTIAAVPGSDTQVCYNDNGALGAEANFLWDDASDRSYVKYTGDRKNFTGAHDGLNNAATLTDSGETWVTNLFVGDVIKNNTDVSSCTITANTATTVTCTLTGGTDNDWDIGDTFKIIYTPDGIATSYRQDNFPTVAKSFDILADSNSPYPGPTLGTWDGATRTPYLRVEPNSGAAGAAVFYKPFNAIAGGAFEGNVAFSTGPHRLQANLMTSGDATPDVSAITVLTTAGSADITDFDAGSGGQYLIVWADSTITVTDGGDLNLNGDFDMVAGDILVLWTQVGTAWYEVTRSRVGIRASGTWDPTSLSDGNGETKSFTVTGAAFGDFVSFSAPYDLQDLLCSCYVQASNTVECRLQNETGGGSPIDLASGTWKFKVDK